MIVGMSHSAPEHVGAETEGNVVTAPGPRGAWERG